MSNKYDICFQDKSDNIKIDIEKTTLCSCCKKQKPILQTKTICQCSNIICETCIREMYFVADDIEPFFKCNICKSVFQLSNRPYVLFINLLTILHALIFHFCVLLSIFITWCIFILPFFSLKDVYWIILILVELTVIGYYYENDNEKPKFIIPRIYRSKIIYLQNTVKETRRMFYLKIFLSPILSHIIYIHNFSSLFLKKFKKDYGLESVNVISSLSNIYTQNWSSYLSVERYEFIKQYRFKSLKFLMNY
jgi:hypothetical protein